MPATSSKLPIHPLADIVDMGFILAIEAARLLGVDRSNINYRLKTGDLKTACRDQSGRLYVLRSEVMEFSRSRGSE